MLVAGHESVLSNGDKEEAAFPRKDKEQQKRHERYRDQHEDAG